MKQYGWMNFAFNDVIFASQQAIVLTAEQWRMQYKFENNGKKTPTKAKIIKKKKKQLKTLVTMTSSMIFINIFIWL